MSITKAPNSPEVPYGEDVSWRFEVTNSGEGDLWALYLWDDTLGQIECPDEHIPVGESLVCHASEPSAVGEHGDRVLASAWGDDGTEVTASADGSYLGLPDADIQMTIRIDGWDPEATDITVVEHAPTVLLYEITNRATEGLSGLFVWDQVHGAVTCPNVYLGRGETLRCWLTTAAKGGEVSGTVTAEAWTDDGYEIEAEATVAYRGVDTAVGLPFLP
jgi:hypothetical protein